MIFTVEISEQADRDLRAIYVYENKRLIFQRLTALSMPKYKIGKGKINGYSTHFSGNMIRNHDNFKKLALTS